MERNLNQISMNWIRKQNNNKKSTIKKWIWTSSKCFGVSMINHRLHIQVWCPFLVKTEKASNKKNKWWQAQLKPLFKSTPIRQLWWTLTCPGVLSVGSGPWWNSLCNFPECRSNTNCLSFPGTLFVRTRHHKTVQKTNNNTSSIIDLMSDKTLRGPTVSKTTAF